MRDLPAGTVTFLFTDVEGSTRLWEHHPDAAAGMLARHDDLIESIVSRRDGVTVRPRGEGDSRFCVFARATDAVAAALEIQRAFARESWSHPLRVRMALHTGEAELRAGDYYGAAVNRCARLRSIAHGGQVLVSSAAEELVREALPDRVSLRDLGTHRLRDLSEPLRVYQLVHPDLPDSFPPLVSLSAASSNLPVQLTTFVGRDVEVAEVRKLLMTERLITLTGAGGAGKTRLALQVAAESLDEFDGGVWLCDLAPLRAPALVPTALAEVVGAREEPGKPIEEAIVATLGAKRVLLVLDNCEHLVGAAAAITEMILRRCRGVVVIATSREPLGVPGETPWRVPSLSMPDTNAGVRADEMASFESVTLFRQRARQIDPSFEVTDDTAAAVAQICAQLDGMPLALELAAARLEALTVQEIAARLDDRFRLLTGGARTAIERQQTLRATVDWSYSLLSDVERILLRRLSVFAGGWSLGSAEDVCDGDGIERSSLLDLLSALVRRSLVVAERTSGRTRYRMLETIRQYAAEKLVESGEAAERHRRHRDHFLALAREAAQGLVSHGQEAWFARVSEELANLNAAMSWSASEGDGERLLESALSLTSFWHTRAMWNEGSLWLQQGLDAAPSSALRAPALVSAAMLEVPQGRVGRARSRCEEARELARSGGDPATEARALALLAMFPMTQDREGLAGMAEEALRIAERSGDGGAEASALQAVAHYALLRDDYPACSDLYRRAVDILRRDGNEIRAARIEVGELLAVHYWRGEPEEILAAVERTSPILERFGDRQSIAFAMLARASACWELGRLDEARAHLEEARRAVDRIGGGPMMQATLLVSDVDIALDSADVGEARRTLEAIEELLGSARTELHEHLVRGWARLHRIEGDMDGVARVCRDGLEPEWRIGNHVGINECLLGIAGAAIAKRDGERAARLLGAAEAMRGRLGIVLPRYLRQQHEEDRASLRALLGEEAMERAWDDGRAMPLEQAVELARSPE